jgi:hypothetical protein
MKHVNLALAILILSGVISSCSKEMMDFPKESSNEQTENETRAMGVEPTSYSATASGKWAIIISGGDNYQSNYIRYWNDCSFFYTTLKEVYGLTDERIIVAMSDGLSTGIDRIDAYGIPESSPWDLDYDSVYDIDYPATESGVLAAFNIVQSYSMPGDEVIIFITDHGIVDLSGKPSIVLWGGDSMTASTFRTLILSINSEVTKHIVMGQCYSGGFISSLQGIKQTTVSTACSATELSYSTSNFEYDEFLYHWTSAISGHYPNGTSANADNDNDGRISVREAFNFAQANDTRNETPQFYEYKSRFGYIPFIYQYKYKEPYISGPIDLNRGATYTFHIENYNPDINPATLVSTSDLTFVSSTDTTITVSVNATGGPKYGPITFHISSSGTDYLNTDCPLDDVVIWQAGSFVDNMGAIEAYYSYPNCETHLLSRFSLVSSAFYWNTNNSNWRILRRILPDASFQFEGGMGNVPDELTVSVDITNPFGGTTTLSKTIDLTE